MYDTRWVTCYRIDRHMLHGRGQMEQLTVVRKEQAAVGINAMTLPICATLFIGKSSQRKNENNTTAIPGPAGAGPTNNIKIAFSRFVVRH